jgi:hypothetical protein
MEIELRCPCCTSRFAATAGTAYEQILDRMVDEGPWYALAEGSTFDEMVRHALQIRGRILCPDCQTTVTVRGISIPRRARELVACH